MTGESSLQTIAEVSVTLAGFAALIAVFRQQGAGSWTPGGLVGVRFMIELSLLAGLFALLPFPLLYLGLSEPSVWQLSSILLLSVYIVLIALSIFRIRSLVRTGARRSRPLYATAMLSTAICGCVLLAWNAIGAVSPTGPSLYLVALLLILVIVAFQLLSMLAVVRTESRD